MKDIIVVGSGIAGLSAALRASQRGHRVRLFAKSSLDHSNTSRAQGGMAVVADPNDSVESHMADTLGAGAGLCDERAVELLCSQGPEALSWLIDQGVPFDRDKDRLALGLEAAHARARIVHCGQDATGAGLAAALIERLNASDIEVTDNTMMADLLVENGKVLGLRDVSDIEYEADGVVLATGGSGQLFRWTTNPSVATADGVAMSLRAGAVVANLEFSQFHPTALAVGSSPLISEAVRGEGAVLVDEKGHRFMTDVDPRAELAPRDVVAARIASVIESQDGRPVLLDATGLGEEFLRRRFPSIDRVVRSYGFDWAAEPIPVAPAAHYAMGGVCVDYLGRTSLENLYAVGEVTCSGVHGANRLASNSLLEGVVAGLRVGDSLAQPWSAQPRAIGQDPVELQLITRGEPFTRDELQSLMWRDVGLLRSVDGLARASETMDRWHADPAGDTKSAEDANLLLVARATALAASLRTESRGAHRRSDFPAADPQQAHPRGVVIAC